MTTMMTDQPDLGIMGMAPVHFFVPGKPISGGSKKAFLHPHTHRIIVTDDAGKPNKEWRAQVVASCREVFKKPVLEGPLGLKVCFCMPRPKGHYGTGRNQGKLKPNAPVHHTNQPDATKLLRALEDALTHILWKDDAQITIQHVFKRYHVDHESPGALVEVTPL